MRAYGVTYDTGFLSRGTTTHEPFDPEIVRREMWIIRHELGCDAIRVTGGDPVRLEIAARHAAGAGLEVWVSPFTNGLTREELTELLIRSADDAERLRWDGGDVVFLTGSEISLFTHGFLPGDGLEERVAVLRDPGRLRAALPELHERVNAFLAGVVSEVRGRFGGRVGYASLPFEGVDWTIFDIAATDAGYRDAATATRFREVVRAQVAQGRPFAVTEFGCVPYRGAADVAGHGDSIVEWDERARPVRLTERVTRDEEEQAAYIQELLQIYDEEGVDTAFVCTFARRDLPTSARAERDFDVASYGIVKVLEDGRSGTAYPGLPWEPKAAFHALAGFA